MYVHVELKIAKCLNINAQVSYGVYICRDINVFTLYIYIQTLRITRVAISIII